MSRALTRRALVASAGAALGVASLPAIAEAVIPASDVDADLFSLLDRFDAAQAAWDATEAPLGAAMDRLVAATPPRPDALVFRFRDYEHDLGGSRGRERKPNGDWLAFYTDADVGRLRIAPAILRPAMVGDDVDPVPMELDPEGEVRRREIVEAYDRWVAACRRAANEVGFTVASEAEDAAADVWSAAEDAVRLCQPWTLAGLARKATWVANRLSGTGSDKDLGEVFARQVAAFGGVST